jgi:copper(I)-binding protein
VALLSACGTGQISQTAQKVSAVEGVSASLKHIDVNDALIATPKSEKYAKGADAPVYFTISNDSLTDDRLVGARTDSGDAVVIAPAEAGTEEPALGCVLSASELEKAAAPSAGASTPEQPVGGASAFKDTSGSPSASPSASASGSASATPSASASGSASATPSASPSPSFSTRINVTVPHDGAVLMTAACPHLLVRNLRRDLLVSDTIKLRLTFARAGVIDLDVPVATPNGPLPRVPVPGFGEHGPPPAEGGHG